MNEDILKNKISFVYADDDILVVRKFSGIPSAPLKELETENALYYVSQKYPQVLQVNNSYKKIEGGLLHRIDTDTDGLLLFALNDFAWQHLYTQQKQNKFEKEYTAFCVKDFSNLEILKGFPDFPFGQISENKKNILITSKFRNYGPEKKQVRPVLENEKTYAQKKASQKLYLTEILDVKKIDSIFKINCKITSGFRHQVRCHLAWAGFPIINDKIYNSNFAEKNPNGNLQFFATKLSFIHPKTNEITDFSIEI
jgi:23S rRNA pseudouridine1911/1915/1917 synthase